MQKWEYLRVEFYPIRDSGGRSIYQVDKVNSQPSNDDGKELMSFLAEIGDEGWEMVSGGSSIIYFKRPYWD